MDYLSAIFTSPAVWSAIILVLNLLAKYLLPDMPVEVVAALNGLLIAILAAVGIGDVRVQVKRVRQMRDFERTLEGLDDGDE